MLTTKTLTLMAMIAFAGNSLLCRAAFQQSNIDPASFTSIRLFSGAFMLWLIVRGSVRRPQSDGSRGDWFSAFALFVYAAGFSFSYVSLSAATGALVLFGAVQSTMIGYGIWTGERLAKVQLLGMLLTLGGLLGLLLPGLSAPPIWGCLFMAAAGIAWGIYSLRGKGAGDPTVVTAGNFWRAAVMAGGLSFLSLNFTSLDVAGVVYAVLSGALASGVGYAIWYSALPGLKATHAATVQLSVPIIAAMGGVALLGEPITVRLVLASLAVLGGIALVILEKQNASAIAD